MTNSSVLPARSGLATLSKRLEIRMLLLAAVIAVALSLLSPYFLTRSNIFNILDQSVVIGIVSVGMTFVILTGGIDLSVGSVAGLTGVLLGVALQHVALPAAIGLAVLAGAGIGLLSGILVAYFGLAAFVVTLGVMAIGRSLAYIFSGQTALSNFPPDMRDIVYTSVVRHPVERTVPGRALSPGLGLSDLHQGRPHHLCGGLQQGGGPRRGAQRPVLCRAALCGVRRACGRGHHVLDLATAVGRSAGRPGYGARRHRGRGDRRRQPVRRAEAR